MNETPIPISASLAAPGQPGASTAARVLLLALLFAAPLTFGAVEGWAWGGISVLASLALLCWGLASIRDRLVQIVWTPLYIPAVLMIVLGLVQWANHTADPIGTREAVIKLVTDILVFFLAANLFAEVSRRIWRMLAWAVAMYTFALAVFAIVQFFSEPLKVYWTIVPRWGGYIFGPYINHNHYAGLMELLIPVAVGFLLGLRPGQPERYFLGFTILVTVSSVVLSGSRGGTTGLLVEAIAFLVAVWLSSASRHKLAAVAACVVIAAAVSVWLIPAAVSERFNSAVHSPDVSYGDRKNMTADSFRIMRHHLALGAGFGAFETVYPQYQSFPTDLVVDYSHNDYAQALAETGIIGGVLMLSALLLFLFSMRAHLAAGLASEPSWIVVGAYVGCIGLLVHSWFDFNLRIPANAAWFVFLVGLTQSLTNRPKLSNPTARVRTSVLAFSTSHTSNTSR